MKRNSGKVEMSVTMWFVVGFLVVVIVGLIVAGIMSGGASSTSSGADTGFSATTVTAITSTDWTIGSSTAPVSLIEYGDFECPACGEYYPVVKQLLAAYGSQIYFAFRNFPLYQIHPDAGIAAQAAEAAGLQGKYWAMHDLLYEDQNTWVSATPSSVVEQYFNGYASSLGMNVSKFDQDINSTQVADKIQADVSSGDAAQINHTPTFFVDDVQIPNPTSYANFQSVITAAIASATTTTAATP